ncbi:hypothetical protein COX28_00945 [Candidatus Kuenenbacteria bacterium CG23_combo_of_CG06-09_8_20_14_all_39_39]|uniref:Haloacid dehalogenase n=2 Tax=Candidatus Kueneniibacteriota TaxID=1752740 RepID=A0A2G9Z7H9_9BACT|nr:MAG: hypothetical protein COX28_00945 [Candidatus Kuenenbacteria bacterium CG23_combo_of_CG06-09_8_20_14_all_39_39]
MIKTIIFDFDDTLKKSEHLKQLGFIETVKNITGAQPIAKELVSKHPGTPRYQMLGIILSALKERGLINFNILEQIIQEYAQKYGKLLTEKIIAAKEIPGAVNALKSLCQPYALYINSATPQNDINAIIDRLSWRTYFKGVFGSPPETKLENIQQIINLENIIPQQTVIIGDGKSDWQSARQCKTKFIGIKGDYNQWPADIDFPILNDLTTLPEEIEKL